MRIRPLILGISLALSASPAVLAVNPGYGSNAAPTSGATGESARAVYLVFFADPPLALWRGDDGGDARDTALQATPQRARGERRLDLRSARSRDYLAVLAQRRGAVLSTLAQRINRPVVPRFVYSLTSNGMALELSAGEAEVLREVPGVTSVQPNFTRRLLTDSGPNWIKANTVWTGAAGVASRGEGTLVGVIDSGINPAHPAFAAAASDGYVHVNPKGAFLGTCASGNTQCNAKLIGIYNFRTADEPENVDKNGHGTHVASTAAGNPVSYPLSVGGGVTVARAGSGVAPRANLISYKACIDDGGSGTCSGDALMAAIEQATADSVDVINYSIGGLPSDPWADPEAMAMLAAREAGVVVVVAAGNSGPQDASVSGPGNAPWVLTAAAATHTRVLSGSIVSDDPAAADQLATFSGRGPNTWLLAPLPAVMKPDLTAPGVDVLAAGRPSDPVGVVLSGTSMATPHIAGAAALLRSAHPDWTPSRIISALQTSARASARTGNAIGRIFDQGSGVVDLSRAVRAGLYFDATGSSPDNIPTFAQANPFVASNPGQPRDLNVPFLLHDACFEACDLRRRVSDMGTGGSWNVTIAAASGIVVSGVPTQFTLAAGASRLLDFHFDVSAPDVSGGWNYGTVTFSKQQNDGTPDVVLPLALLVSAGPGPNPEGFRFMVDADAGMREIALTGLRALPEARFTGSALVRSLPSNIMLPGDPTPDDPFDDATGTNTAMRVTVPEDAAGLPKRWRVLVRALSTSAQDIDLYVGIDNNRDGKGSFDELVCFSADADADEACQFDVTHPGEGGDLRYWVAVQNFAAAGAGSDAVRIDAVAVPLEGPDADTLSASGPGHVDRLGDITLRLRWDDPSFLAGETRFGVLRVRPSADAIAAEYLIELERSAGSEPVPRLLRNGVTQPLTLAPGASHERVYFDVPPNATSVLFELVGSAPRVDLFVSRLAAPNPPAGSTAIEPAPARNQAVASVTGTSGIKRITVSGGQLAPGRWYVTPVSTFQNAPIPAPIRATVLTAATPPSLRLGHYWNTARVGSSSGVFVDRAAGNPDQWVVVWYSYLEDGTPTWYISQAAAPQSAQDVFSGPLWRVAWDGSKTLLNTIGHITIVATGEEAFTFSYTLEGQAGSEPFTRLGGAGCVNFQGSDLDVTGHWFTGSKSGFGYSVQIDAGSNQEIFAAYLYDAKGFPRWLFGQQMLAPGQPVIMRQSSGGPCPTCAFAQTPEFANWAVAGPLLRDYASNDIARIALSAQWQPPLTGDWSEDLPVESLSARKLCQ